MCPVTVKDIPGFEIARLDLMKMKFPEQGVAYNKAIDLQGQVKLGLNRENLEIKIYGIVNDREFTVKELANAIKANEDTLLEVVK